MSQVTCPDLWPTNESIRRSPGAARTRCMTCDAAYNGLLRSKLDVLFCWLDVFGTASGIKLVKEDFGLHRVLVLSHWDNLGIPQGKWRGVIAGARTFADVLFAGVPTIKVLGQYPGGIERELTFQPLTAQEAIDSLCLTQVPNVRYNRRVQSRRIGRTSGPGDFLA